MRFFVTRLKNGRFISYRCRMTGIHQEGTESRPDATTGTAILALQGPGSDLDAAESLRCHTRIR